MGELPNDNLQVREKFCTLYFVTKNKPVPAAAIWNMSQLDAIEPTRNVQYVFDGSALLQRIPWKLGKMYKDVFSRYTNYVGRK